MKKSAVIVESVDILGGIPIFRGTRVPASTLADYMIKGHSLADFLDDFPSVTAEQARLALSEWKSELLGVHYESLAG